MSFLSSPAVGQQHVHAEVKEASAWHARLLCLLLGKGGFKSSFACGGLDLEWHVVAFADVCSKQPEPPAWRI